MRNLFQITNFSSVAKIAENTALLFVTLSICVVVMEGAVRIFFPHQVIPGVLDLNETHYRPDPLLGHVLKPNLRSVPFERPGSFRTVTSTNSMGLRDKEYTFEKAPGVTRIVAMGDSFTWGWGVDQDRIYTELLESRLHRTEVINFGVSGYGLRQEIDYLKREGLKFNPDVVVLGFCLNDIYRAPISDAGKSVERTGEPETRGILSHIKELLRDNSHLYEWAIARVNTNKSLVNLLVRMGLKDGLNGFDALDPNLGPALISYPASMRASFEKTKSELLELKTLTDRLGIRLVVAVIPAQQSVVPLSFQHTISYIDYDPDDFDLDKPYRLLKEYAASKDIELIAPVDAFRKAQSREISLYLRNDMHFSAAGHKLFADALGDYLETSKVVRPTEPNDKR